ncbi:peptidase associated/transthyretin-like domain-containing protein [Roseimaritima ulvae]|uniref:Carboxypeptidase regulatory-like domain-containing protein n=1 Tax=Roseimaritima ulvae TaxID=980254 RepID=A0A5B9R2C9_9BACT|nr:carboxypeptidase-like regulatory domain-containing protein [Roseimaritima ulvae]QEG43546.1 hypothetical protein UC8_55970 [Roseimaritima ulvae]
MSRIVAVVCLVGCAVLTMGCGASGPSGTVSGTVTMDGQGVPAQVAFKSDNATVSGISDASGAFTLTNGDSSSIPVGKYQVSVTDVSGDAQMSQADYDAMMTGGAAAPKTESKIPAKYASFGSSGLEFTVTEGANTFDITLE